MTDQPYADPAHQPFFFPAGPIHALLIPGFMGTPRELRPLGEALAEAGVTARGILLPGFGPDVGRLRRVGAANWIGAAEAAWDEVRGAAERTVLVGFSMGGALALALAARRPPDRLVLLAPHWRFADRRAIALPVLKYVIRAFQPYAAADFDDPRIRLSFAQSHPGFDLDDPEARRRLMREAALPTTALDHLRRVSAAGGRAARRVRTPTLIVQGRADKTVLPGDTRRLAARLPGPVEHCEIDGDHLLVDPNLPSWPAVRDAVVAFATAETGG